MSRDDFRYSSLCSYGLSSLAQRVRTCSGAHTGGRVVRRRGSVWTTRRSPAGP
eukprot:COSAG02_NODE_4396_length_5408_cov_13.262938_5_plen_53_part_00